jgi:hypothetical protein
MRGTTNNPNSESPTNANASARFKFDNEMDRLWTNCKWLADSRNRNAAEPLPALTSTLVKPLHLALGLIFDGLREHTDPRLYTDKSDLPRTLELPLFWTAISRASGCGGIISQATTRLHDERLLQQCIGQALWKRLDGKNRRHEESASSNTKVSRKHEMSVLTRRQ